MNVTTLYSATRHKTNGILTKNSADRSAYLYTSPSIAMLRCCDPDGVNIALRFYEGAMYLVELKSSQRQLALQGFNVLQRQVFLYQYAYPTHDCLIEEDGTVAVHFDFPKGEFVGNYIAFDYIGEDAQVARMIFFEDLQGSSAYEFLFRPTAVDRKASPFLFPFSLF